VTREEFLHDLLTERYRTPVREWKPRTRTCVADLLDALRDTEDDEDMEVA
jgi:hypothetical protein